MTQIYVERLRKVFASSDIDWGYCVFVLVVAQLFQASDFPTYSDPSPAYFISRSFRPLAY